MSNILKISEATTIALHSMVFLSVNSDRMCCVKEIAGRFGISENHLSKVMQRLAKAGLVESIKGPHGGFKLAKSCNDITFLQIYEVIDGPLKTGCCLFGKQVCGSSKCIMGGLLQSTSRQVREYFENKKLSDFCESKDYIDSLKEEFLCA